MANPKSEIRNPRGTIHPFAHSPIRPLSHLPFGFTLIELVVVIGVVAVLAAVTLPAVNRLSEGNRNVSCQVNMHALYEAIKMYRLDEAGYPPFDPDPTASTTCPKDDCTNLGLWALHAYPGGCTDTTVSRCSISGSVASVPLSNPTARYIRGVKSMHCPDHNDSASYDVDPNRYTDPTDSTYFNFRYLSYQFKVPTTGQPWTNFADKTSDDARYTYDVNHPEVTSTDSNYRRQLFPYAPAVSPPPRSVSSWYPDDNTVITWCVHHRQYTREGTDQDNVLFLDGSVKRLPVKQTMGTKCTDLQGWKRLPETECQ